MDGSESTRSSRLIRLRDPRDELAWSDFTEIYRPLIEYKSRVVARIRREIERVEGESDETC